MQKSWSSNLSAFAEQNTYVNILISLLLIDTFALFKEVLKTQILSMLAEERHQVSFIALVPRHCQRHNRPEG